MRSILTVLLTAFCLTAFVGDVGAMTRADWNSNDNIQIFREDTESALEIIRAMAPVWSMSNFMAPRAIVSSTGSTTTVGNTLDFVGDDGLYVLTIINSGTAEVVASTDRAYLVCTNGTADDDDTDVASPLVFTAEKGCGIEARIRCPQSADSGFNIGFTDAQDEGADDLAVEYSGTTLTSNASDCALWFFDSDATTDSYYCVAVDTNVDGTVTTSGVSVDTDWHTFRVWCNADGDCEFWLDGTEVYTESSGITETTALCAYVGLINRAAGANTMEIDYIAVWERR